MPGEQPVEKPLQPGEPDGTAPGDTRAPTINAAEGQVQTASTSSSQGTAQ
jgi:hypothetical protein